MKKFVFFVNGLNYTRVNKATARKAYTAGNTVIICPCNLRPGSPWFPECYINYSDRDETETETPAADLFTKIINAHSFYNCINSETGTYPAFYIAL